ncbi:MAG: hypothetical protein R2854_16080 [Caldilineaceae bacterium]
MLSDEIYEHIIYDGGAPQPGRRAGHGRAHHHRQRLLQGVRDDRVARAGWPRLPVAKLARTLQTQSITSAASFATAGAVALQRPPECVHEMTAHSAAALHARRAGRDPGHRVCAD